MLHTFMQRTKTFFTFVHMMTTQFHIDAQAKLNLVQKRYCLVRDCILD